MRVIASAQKREKEPQKLRKYLKACTYVWNFFLEFGMQSLPHT